MIPRRQRAIQAWLALSYLARDLRLAEMTVRGPLTGSPEPKYDVALSFAGEDREYVEQVAAALKDRLRVFYDKYETVELWGKDLGERLDYVYREASRYCVLFASVNYEHKVWTNHERRSAQVRAIESNEDYVLPVRLDDTEIPGLRPTVAYIDAREITPEHLANLILAKVGEGSERTEDDASSRVIGLAVDDPRGAFLLLRDEIELALRRLLAQSGWLDGGFGVPVTAAVARLVDMGILARATAMNFAWFIQNGVQILDDAPGSNELARTVVDGGLTLLKGLEVVPREVNVIDHPGVEIFRDDQCNQHYPEGRGVILQTISAGATSVTRRIFPTTRGDYERGKLVAWEWNNTRQWDDAWYRDPETGETKYAWGGSLEFIGRHLDEVGATGEWGDLSALEAP